MLYKLILLDPERDVVQHSWVLNLPATVGRSPDLDVCIDHGSISRSHCRFFLSPDGALTIRDLGSLNGTYVNDEKVNHAMLMPGDTLQLGSLTLRVEFSVESDHAIPKMKFKGSVTATQPMPKILPNLSAPIPQPPKKWWQFWKSQAN